MNRGRPGLETVEDRPEAEPNLDAPVRRYVPELRLADERAAGQVTVLNLLNHTAGLDRNLVDTEEGDGSPAACRKRVDPWRMMRS